MAARNANALHVRLGPLACLQVDRHTKAGRRAGEVQLQLVRVVCYRILLPPLPHHPQAATL
eukprot:1361995-Prymnesium_polylepis.1